MQLLQYVTHKNASLHIFSTIIAFLFTIKKSPQTLTGVRRRYICLSDVFNCLGNYY